MKITKSLGLFVVVLAILLSAPLLLNVSRPTCSLDGANAQDNPCLAQDATISAMNVALLQATLDTMSYQATITALQNNVGVYIMPEVTEIGSVSSIVGLPFTETFDNNDRGWQLHADEYTSSTFSRGALNLRTARDTSCSRIAVPDVNNQEFYLEVDVTSNGIDDDTRWNSGYIGFTIGQINYLETYNNETLTYLLIGRDRTNADWYVYAISYNFEEEEWTTLANTLYARQNANVWKVNESFQLALEARNGFYSMFFNDEIVEGFQITPIGSEVGLVVCGNDVRESYWGNSTFSARFDNLTVRQSR